MSNGNPDPINKVYGQLEQNNLIKKDDYSFDDFKSWIDTDPNAVSTLYKQLEGNNLIKKDDYSQDKFKQWLIGSEDKQEIEEVGDELDIEMQYPKAVPEELKDMPASVMRHQKTLISKDPSIRAIESDPELLDPQKPRSEWLVDQRKEKRGLSKIAAVDKTELEELQKDPIDKINFERSATIAQNEAIVKSIDSKVDAINNIAGFNAVDFMLDFEKDYQELQQKIESFKSKDDPHGAEAAVKKWKENNKQEIDKYNNLLKDTSVRTGMNQIDQLTTSYKKNRKHFKEIAAQSPEYQQMERIKRVRQKMVDAVDDKNYYIPKPRKTVDPSKNYWTRFSFTKPIEIARYFTRALANITDIDLQGDVDLFDRLDQSLADVEKGMENYAPLKTELKRGMFERYADYKGKRVYVDADKNIVSVTNPDGSIADENWNEDFIKSFKESDAKVSVDFNGKAFGHQLFNGAVDFGLLMGMAKPISAGLKALGTPGLAAARTGTTIAAGTQVAPRFYDAAKRNGASDDFASYYSAITGAMIGLVNAVNPLEAGRGMSIAKYITPKVASKELLERIANKGMTESTLKAIKRRSIAAFASGVSNGIIEGVEEGVLERMAERLSNNAIDAMVPGNMVKNFDPIESLNEFSIGALIGGMFGGSTTMIKGIPNSEYYKQSLYAAAEDIETYEKFKDQLSNEDPERFTKDYFEKIDARVYGAKEAFDAIPGSDKIRQKDRVDLYHALQYSKELEETLRKIPIVAQEAIVNEKSKVDEHISKILSKYDIPVQTEQDQESKTKQDAQKEDTEGSEQTRTEDRKRDAESNQENAQRRESSFTDTSQEEARLQELNAIIDDPKAEQEQKDQAIEEKQALQTVIESKQNIQDESSQEQTADDRRREALSEMRSTTITLDEIDSQGRKRARQTEEHQRLSPYAEKLAEINRDMNVYTPEDSEHQELLDMGVKPDPAGNIGRTEIFEQQEKLERQAKKEVTEEAEADNKKIITSERRKVMLDKINERYKNESRTETRQEREETQPETGQNDQKTSPDEGDIETRSRQPDQTGRTVEQQEIESQLDEAIKERDAAQTEYDKQAKAFDESIRQDQEDLFGNRESQSEEKLFDERADIDPERRKEALAPARARLEKAEQNVSQLREQLENQGSRTSQKNIFDQNKTVEQAEKELPQEEKARKEEVKDNLRAFLFGEEQYESEYEKDKAAKENLKSFEPRNAREAAIQWLAEGNKLNTENMAHELGYIEKPSSSKNFREKRFVVNQEGKTLGLKWGKKDSKTTIESAAEDIVADNYGRGVKLNEQDVRNELIEALKTLRGTKDARQSLLDRSREDEQEMPWNEDILDFYASEDQKDWDGATFEMFEAIIEEYTDENGNFNETQLAQDIYEGKIELPPEIATTVYNKIFEEEEGGTAQEVRQTSESPSEKTPSSEERGRVSENLKEIPDGLNPNPFYNANKEVIDSDPELQEQFEDKKAAYREERDKQLEERRKKVTEHKWKDANKRKASFNHAGGKLNGIVIGEENGKYVIVGDNGITYKKDSKDVMFADPLEQKGDGSKFDPSEQATKKYISWIAKKLKRINPNIEFVVDRDKFKKAFKNTSSETRLQKDEDGPIGFVDGDTIYINPDRARLDTPIHEFAHPFILLVRSEFPSLYERGMELAADSPYYEWAKDNYSQREGEQNEEFEERLRQEAWAQSIGENGAEIMHKRFKARNNPFKRLQRFIKKFWGKVKEFFGVRSVVDFENLNLAGINKLIVRDAWSQKSLVNDSDERLKWMNDNIKGFYFRENVLKEFILRNFQDKNRSLYNTQEAIKARGGKITNRTDVYRFKELQAGKARYLIEKFEEEMLRSKAHSKDSSFMERYDKAVDKDAINNLVQVIKDELGFDMSGRGYSEPVEVLSLYMYAKHAPEANKVLKERIKKRKQDKLADLKEKIEEAKKEGDSKRQKKYEKEHDRIENDNHPRYTVPGEGPSGMMDEEAEVVLEKFEEQGLTEVMEQYSQEFRENVLDKIPEMLNDYGLIDQKTKKALQKTYKNYAPLKVLEKSRKERTKGGGSWNVSHTGVFSRKGASKYTPEKRENLIMAAMHMFEDTIMRGEQNRTNNSLRELAQEYQNDDHWELISPRYRPKFNEFGDHSGFEPIENFDESKDIKVWVDGKPEFIRIHNEELRKTIKERAIGKAANLVISSLRPINNWLRWAFTIHNPEFMLTNFQRDVVTAFTNISQEEAEGLKREFVSGIPSAFKAVYLHELGKGKGQWHEIVEDYKKHGGDISWVMHKTLNEFAKQAQKNINRANKVGTFNKARQASWYLYSYIDAGTRAAELASRVSAYKAMINAGISKEEAAQKAKNLTINFEKKGDLGSLIDSIFLFTNAGLQQAKIMGDAMIKSPKVRAVVGSWISVGFLTRMLNHFIDEDEYWAQYSTYKDTYLILMLPKSVQDKLGINHISIPKAYGYGFFFTLGEKTYEAVNGITSPTDAFVDSALSFYNNMSPVKASDFIDMFTPTFLKGAASAYRNKTYYGGPVYPEQPAYQPKKKNSSLYFERTVNPISKDFTKWLNNVSGGNDIEAGNLDISPEVIDHLIGQYTGGTGKFWTDMITLPFQFEDGDLPNIREIPMLRKMFGDTPEGAYTAPIFEMYNESGRTQYSEEEREIFFKYMDMAKDKKLLTPRLYKRLKTQFIENQNILDREEKKNAELTKK